MELLNPLLARIIHGGNLSRLLCEVDLGGGDTVHVLLDCARFTRYRLNGTDIVARVIELGPEYHLTGGQWRRGREVLLMKELRAVEPGSLLLMPAAWTFRDDFEDVQKEQLRAQRLLKKLDAAALGVEDPDEGDGP